MIRLVDKRETDEENDEEEKSKGIEILSLPKQFGELVVDTGKDDEISKQCLEEGREYQTNNDRRNALKYFTYSLFYAKSIKSKGEAYFERGNLFRELNYSEAALDDLIEADKVRLFLKLNKKNIFLIPSAEHSDM